MELSYKWKITEITKKKVDNTDDVVLHSRWKLTGTNPNTGTEGTFAGATPLEYDAASLTNFVPFESLTEDLVVGWVSSSVTGENGYFDHISEQIEKQIEEIDNPTEEVEETDLPWSPSPTSGSTESTSGSI